MSDISFPLLPNFKNLLVLFISVWRGPVIPKLEFVGNESKY